MIGVFGRDVLLSGFKHERTVVMLNHGFGFI